MKVESGTSNWAQPSQSQNFMFAQYVCICLSLTLTKGTHGEVSAARLGHGRAICICVHACVKSLCELVNIKYRKK